MKCPICFVVDKASLSTAALKYGRSGSNRRGAMLNATRRLNCFRDCHTARNANEDKYEVKRKGSDGVLVSTQLPCIPYGITL